MRFIHHQQANTRRDRKQCVRHEVVVPGPAHDVQGKPIGELHSPLSTGRVRQRGGHLDRRTDAGEVSGKAQPVVTSALGQHAAAAADAAREGDRSVTAERVEDLDIIDPVGPVAARDVELHVRLDTGRAAGEGDRPGHPVVGSDGTGRLPLNPRAALILFEKIHREPGAARVGCLEAAGQDVRRVRIQRKSARSQIGTPLAARARDAQLHRPRACRMIAGVDRPGAGPA